jgi:hypothetical protein
LVDWPKCLPTRYIGKIDWDYLDRDDYYKWANVSLMFDGKILVRSNRAAAIAAGMMDY